MLWGDPNNNLTVDTIWGWETIDVSGDVLAGWLDVAVCGVNEVFAIGGSDAGVPGTVTVGG